MGQTIRIGTRASNLALWQARHVADLLRPLAGPQDVELVPIHTTGDQVRDVPLGVIGGQGVFTKEIQEALRDGRADVAVHSLKDLPTLSVPGLILAAVPKRAPTGDALLSHRWRRFDDLPPGARVATGSSRRKAQLLNRRPDLAIVDVRGNVETRLRKLKEQELDALILAEAGLRRLGLDAEIREVLDPGWMLPAVGQGALGIECRAADTELREILRALNDADSWWSVLAERAFLAGLGGGCSVPIAATAKVTAGRLELRGAVLRADGSERLEGSIVGEAASAVSLGKSLASALLDRGAEQLLKGEAMK